jgi:hypothetical protein
MVGRVKEGPGHGGCEYLRGRGCSCKCRLPLCIENIGSIIETPEVLSELGNSYNVPRSIALKTDEQTSPDDE